MVRIQRSQQGSLRESVPGKGEAKGFWSYTNVSVIFFALTEVLLIFLENIGTEMRTPRVSIEIHRDRD